MDAKKLQNDAVNTIRFLSADAVQNANSGHAGLPMGTAAIAYTLYKKHLKFNPHNPEWPDRDRFVLSGGHGSMLLPETINNIEQLPEQEPEKALCKGRPE